MISAKTNKPVGSINVNLYNVATGPTHFDFQVSEGSGFLGRIIFDCRFSQFITVTLKSPSLVCKMNQNLNDKYYYYVMTLIDQKRLRHQSKRSGLFENVFLNTHTTDITEDSQRLEKSEDEELKYIY